jgi:hypothetical protein
MIAQNNAATLRQQLYGNLDLKQHRQRIAETCDHLGDQPILAAAHVWHGTQLLHCIITPERIYLVSANNSPGFQPRKLNKTRILRIQQGFNGIAIQYPSSKLILLHWSLPRLPSKEFRQQLKAQNAQPINLIPPTTTQKALFSLSLGFIILGPILAPLIPAPPPQTAQTITTYTPQQAHRACKQDILSQLKAPSTAKIEIFNTGETSLRIIVVGQVTSQNSFGAMLTSGFTCEFIEADGTATASILE